MGVKVRTGARKQEAETECGVISAYRSTNRQAYFWSLTADAKKFKQVSGRDNFKQSNRC